MNRILLALGALLLFSPAQPTMGQQATDSQRFVNLDRLAGTWRSQEEVREDPTEAWESGSSEWVVRWMPGKYVADTSGKLTVGDRETSWIQLWGFDPHINSMVSWYADSSGAIGTVTSAGWDGTTFSTNFTDTTPGGETVIGRCAWEHSADFESVSGTCERFSDGRWWTFRKFKGKKSK